MNIRYLRETYEVIFSCLKTNGEICSLYFDKNMKYGKDYTLFNGCKSIYGYSVLYLPNASDYYVISDLICRGNSYPFLYFFDNDFIKNINASNNIIDDIIVDSNEIVNKNEDNIEEEFTKECFENEKEENEEEEFINEFYENENERYIDKKTIEDYAEKENEVNEINEDNNQDSEEVILNKDDSESIIFDNKEDNACSVEDFLNKECIFNSTNIKLTQNFILKVPHLLLLDKIQKSQ